jgi:hypothetical protein
VLPPRCDSGRRAALAAIAETQLAIVRRDQLRELGLPRHVVDAMLDARRWQSFGQVVVVMHNGPLTYAQQLWVAVLNAGGLVALAARTAATDFGLDGWQPECIEILVPKGTLMPPGLPFDVKVHESRRFTAADLHPARPLPVRIERALIDGAVWSRGSRTACGLIAAGVQQRLTTASRLISELDNAGAVNHRRRFASKFVGMPRAGGATSTRRFGERTAPCSRRDRRRAASRRTHLLG